MACPVRHMADGGMPYAATGNTIATLPNLITLGRICIVPVAVWLALQDAWRSTFVLFVIAGLSDALDGWLARRGAQSALGALLDPLADKALLVCMFITLAATNVLPLSLAILVVFRDVLIVGGVLALAILGHRVAIQPLLVSKLNTVMQIMLVAVALFMRGFPWSVGSLLELLIWAVVASTVVSGVAYVWVVARAPWVVSHE